MSCSWSGTTAGERVRGRGFAGLNDLDARGRNGSSGSAASGRRWLPWRESYGVIWSAQGGRGAVQTVGDGVAAASGGRGVSNARIRTCANAF